MLSSEKGTGAKMRPAIVCGIATGHVPVSYWLIFFLSLVTVPAVFANVNSALVPFMFWKWRKSEEATQGIRCSLLVPLLSVVVISMYNQFMVMSEVIPLFHEYTIWLPINIMGDELLSQSSSTIYLLESFLMCSFVCLGFLKRLSTSFNALTSSFITFSHFVAILVLRRREGFYSNFVISLVKL